MSTKTPKSGSAAPQDLAQETTAKFQETFANFSEKMEVPPAAREFLQRAASTAKEKLADVHAGATEATETYEKTVAGLVGGGATLARSMLQAGYENTLATFAMIEKLANAKSVQEAFTIQSEFAREYARTNWSRVQSAAETAKANVQDGVKLIQDQSAKVLSLVKKAA